MVWLSNFVQGSISRCHWNTVGAAGRINDWAFSKTLAHISTRNSDCSLFSSPNAIYTYYYFSTNYRCRSWFWKHRPHVAGNAVVHPLQCNCRRHVNTRRFKGVVQAFRHEPLATVEKSLYSIGFPFLVTGWVTAAGGAWNASIVAEYVVFRRHTLTARGLGAMISQSAERADFALLTGAVLTMAAIVVIFNRVVWRSLYNMAEKRYAIE